MADPTRIQSAIVDSVDVDKGGVRTAIDGGTVQVYDDAADLLARSPGGQWVIYVKSLQTWFRKATEDTSASNGTTVLTDGDGVTWLKVSGTAVGIDAAGDFAGRDTYDDEALGFVYFSEDGSVGSPAGDPVLFVKLSAASADWSVAVPFKGADGSDGTNGTNGTDGAPGTGLVMTLIATDDYAALSPPLDGMIYFVPDAYAGDPVTMVNLISLADEAAYNALTPSATTVYIWPEA